MRVKVAVSVVLVLSYFLLPRYGFSSNAPLLNFFLYPLSHANLFHLAANISFLWLIKCRMHIFASYLLAVCAAFLPQWSLVEIIFSIPPQPVYGFSGVLMASVGISWGNCHRFRDMFFKNKWILLVMLLLPNINFLIHIYSLLLGYLYGSVKTYRKWNRK